MNMTHFLITDVDYSARIVRLLEHLRIKQSDAEYDLFTTCYPQLCAISRARLGRKLQDFDEDIALGVISDFIRQYQAGVLETVRDSNGLWGVLRFKVHKRVQRIARQTYKRNTQIPISPTVTDWQNPISRCRCREWEVHPIDDIESLAMFFQCLPEKHHQLFNMGLAGVSTAELAKQFGVTARTIRNRYSRILKKWRESNYGKLLFRR